MSVATRVTGSHNANRAEGAWRNTNDDSGRINDDRYGNECDNYDSRSNNDDSGDYDDNPRDYHRAERHGGARTGEPCALRKRADRDRCFGSEIQTKVERRAGLAEDILRQP